MYISNPKTGIKQIEQFNMSPGLCKKAQDLARPTPMKDAAVNRLAKSITQLTL